MNDNVNQLEAHYLAGGTVARVIDALIAAHRAQIPLTFERSCAIALAGRNVLEAVQMSVNPEVIETPVVAAVAKNGIELKVKARVTVRANIDRLEQQGFHCRRRPLLRSGCSGGIERCYREIIGTGEEKYEWYLNTLRDRFGDKVSVNLLFDGGLANLVYAASDLYLMPSKSEPCGLSQLIAMRMGSVPVVNATGGLKDTVWPYNEADETGRGFTFQSYNADDFLAAIDRALALYYNEPDKWLRLAENDMAVDSSWDDPAQKYMALFQNVCGQ